ncbi:hypothetical protein [Paraburkholderia sp. UYCP14C]|nr:hypothetical protein [Paraburkholderia sp. UYCP14C]
MTMSIPASKMKYRPTIIGPGSQTADGRLGQRLLRNNPGEEKHRIDW